MTTRIEQLRRLAKINELNAHGPAETWSAIFLELDEAGFFASIDAFEANPNRSEGDKRRWVIRAAVEFEILQGPAFTPTQCRGEGQGAGGTAHQLHRQPGGRLLRRPTYRPGTGRPH